MIRAIAQVDDLVNQTLTKTTIKFKIGNSRKCYFDSKPSNALTLIKNYLNSPVYSARTNPLILTNQTWFSLIIFYLVNLERCELIHSFENGIYVFFSCSITSKYLVIMLQTLFLEETLSHDSFIEINANCSTHIISNLCLAEPRCLQRRPIA